MAGDPGKEMLALRSLRNRFTYANVMSTLAAVIALGGASAFAAAALPAESVGTRQLKEEAVTAAKIKDGAVRRIQLATGAVTGDRLAPEAVSGDKLAGGSVSADKLTAGAVGTEKLADGGVNSSKLADGSVTSSKLADGSVTAQKLAAGLAGGPQIVHRSRATATLEFPPLTAQANPVDYPLEDATYVQPAGEDDFYVASMQVHVPATCKSTRTAKAHLSIDAGSDFARDLIGWAAFSNDTSGDRVETLQFVPTELGRGSTTAAPSAPVTHTFSIKLDSSSCEGKAGVLSHITIVGAQVDVIGFR
jgi:trimeric autotransporter adhesin